MTSACFRLSVNACAAIAQKAVGEGMRIEVRRNVGSGICWILSDP